jgi:hypothetical protein
VRLGVPLVLEAGTDPNDDLSAVVTALGGVHLVPYDCLAPRVQWLLQDPSRWRLTEVEVARWRAYKAALFDWDGTAGALQALLTPGLWSIATSQNGRDSSWSRLVDRHLVVVVPG